MSGSLSQYRCSFAEAEAILSLIKRYFGSTFSHAYITFVGSAARGGADSYGDIDILISVAPDWKESIKEMIAGIFGRNQNGSPRMSGVIGRTQVDLFLCEASYCGATELFYTLPRNLQISLRTIAASRGYKFGPKGIYDRETGAFISTRSTKDVYNLLGVTPFTLTQMQAVESYRMEEIPNDDS